MMEVDVTKAYNELPALPPKQDIETKKILKMCIEARASLAGLRKAAEMLPNQSVLINSLPLLEAQASSEIENIVTTTDKLFQYANSSSETNIDLATKEALRYRTALREGFESIKSRPLNTVLAENLCSTLHGVEMTVRKVPGTTLSKMAIGHYQFEAIHPFTDGNGRTGRILNILYLIEQELLTIPVLYLSRYIIKHKKEYYQYLLNVTLKDDWESWIIYILNAVATTSQWTCNKIKNILSLMEETVAYVKNKQPKIYSRELVELLFVQPYCRISNVVDTGIVKRQTAAEYLQKFVSEGILKEIAIGREKIYINTRFMQILFKDTD
ncbi:MAG: Fic family protein [Gammaproteobacteria bacterium]|nr:Fic family protein [Gammaproteobacteria bacterium]